MKWFRLYTEIIDDPKLYDLTDNEFRGFIYLLCLACEQGYDGVIPLVTGIVSRRTRIRMNRLRTLLDKLKTLNIITENGDGIEFIHWKYRQFKSDDISERVKKHREMKRYRNVTCNDFETPPETETETEPPIAPQVSDNLFALFWVNYPRKIGKGAARKAWQKIKDPQAVIEKIKVKLPLQMESEQWVKDNGQYIPHPATYINQERWEDEIE